ncbi:MAG: deoxyhypusine synthase family protein [Bryobacterales bacterium]|nr:deoxyhypusine synthase family protein [Bryobacterales bacterium]MDE0629678.1 deoxyhypusine synthase family protein [Bryobacterales bacterium]
MHHGAQKGDFLERPTDPFRVEAANSATSLLEKMAATGFQGRQLGEAFEVWKAMLADPECTILMGLAGAMVPGGMRRVVRFMIENRLIDILTSTGANFFHDIHESKGFLHYQGSAEMDDEVLGDLMVDRMHDILADEVRFREHDLWIGSFAARLDQARPYTTREFLYRLGVEVGRDCPEDGIVTAAAKHRVPLFCPAIGDSSIGIGVAESRHRGENRLMFDMMADVLEITNAVADSKATGVIYFGGGTPKNYTQQSEVVAILMNRGKSGHRYGLQVVTDAPHWGGLSGCTLAESQSWGKIAKGARMVDCHCDSTIAMPLLVSALAEQKALLENRQPPSFDMGRVLKIRTS